MAASGRSPRCRRSPLSSSWRPPEKTAWRQRRRSTSSATNCVSCCARWRLSCVRCREDWKPAQQVLKWTVSVCCTSRRPVYRQLQLDEQRLEGKGGGSLPHSDPSSTGFYELPSLYTFCSSCCWFWPAWCLCPRRTTAVHCPTTSPVPSTLCCGTPTALRPHENCHNAQLWS